MNNKLSLLVNFVGVDKMSGALKNIVGLGKKGSDSLRGLNGEVKRLNGEIKRYDRLMAQSSGNVTTLWNKQKALLQELEQVQARINRQQRIAAIEADRRAMIARGDELKQRGQGNMMGGAAMAAPMILAVREAGEFSSGMVDIQQKVGLADRETDRLANRVIALANAARQMPEAMRSGLDLLLARGMSVDAATDAIGPAGRLATAFKVDLPDAAGAAFASLSNLKIASRDTGRVFDAMAAAGNAGGFEIADMARNFPALTAQLQALGDTGVPAVADLSAALQVAMHTAGNADEAANNVKNLLAKINAPATIRAFKKNFGVDLPAAMKKLTDAGYSSLEAITMVTKQATGGDMKKLGFAFEDMQARQGIMAMIQNMEEYRDIRRQALNSGGTVDKAFDQRVARDAMVEWNAFKATTASVAIALGTTLLPVVTEVFRHVGRIAMGVADWAQANPQLAATLMKAAGALITLKVGLGAAQFLLGSFMGPLANVIAIARRAAPVLTMLRTAALFMGQGMMRAGAMMLANPIVLIITAIVVAIGAAAYLIYSHWDKIKGAFTAGVKWVKSLLAGMPNWLKNIGRLMMDGLLLAINPMALGAKLIHMAKNGITAFKNFLGIKSPSRVFMALGEYTTQGLARGIDRGRRGPVRAVSRVAAGVAAAGAVSLAPAFGATPARGGPAQAAAPAPIVVNVYGAPGQNVDELARAVVRRIEQLQGVKARSSYEGGR